MTLLINLTFTRYQKRLCFGIVEKIAQGVNSLREYHVLSSLQKQKIEVFIYFVNIIGGFLNKELRA